MGDRGIDTGVQGERGLTCSIVVPLYNKASHVRRALDSIRAQAIQEFEVVVVDDGSTDGGGDVVRALDDPRIRLLTQENSGVSAARNRGAHESLCELVAFLDADDAWEPDFLETVLALHERFPEAGVYGTAYRLVRRDGSLVLPTFHGRLSGDSGEGTLEYFAGARGYSPLHSSAVVLRKHALFSAGGFPVGVVFSEDHDTWLRLALRHQIAWSARPGARVYEDAENRTDGYLYLGNYPFFESVHAYEVEQGVDRAPDSVYAYLARCHTGLLRNKLLAGEPRIMREIVHDCWEIRGYRLRCIWWFMLSWVPYRLVSFAWKMKRRLSGRGSDLPPRRRIRSR